MSTSKNALEEHRKKIAEERWKKIAEQAALRNRNDASIDKAFNIALCDIILFALVTTASDIAWRVGESHIGRYGAEFIMFASIGCALFLAVSIILDAKLIYRLLDRKEEFR